MVRSPGGAVEVSQGRQPLVQDATPSAEPRRGDRDVVLSPLRGYHLGDLLPQGLTPLANLYRPSGAPNRLAGEQHLAQLLLGRLVVANLFLQLLRLLLPPVQVFLDLLLVAQVVG